MSQAPRNNIVELRKTGAKGEAMREASALEGLETGTFPFSHVRAESSYPSSDADSCMTRLTHLAKTGDGLARVQGSI